MRITDATLADALGAAAAALAPSVTLVAQADPEAAVAVGPLGAVLNAGAPAGLADEAVHPYMLALEHARSSELAGPGSARACLAYARLSLRRALRTPLDVSGRPFTRQDVRCLLEGVLAPQDAEAFSQLVAAAGASRYVVERRPSRVDNVEFTDSYEFRHGSKPVEGSVSMDNAKVLVADAFVESVAEVHGVLDRCARDGERLVVCARGFSDDVAHTLAVNRQRGTLAAYGLTFPFDEADANTLVDIATVAGCDVVSSLKGQLLTAVDAGSLPRLPRVRLRGDTLDVQGDGARERVALVLAGVRAKAENADEFSRPSLERRARRLSGACVTVRLADGVGYQVRAEAWDLAFRTLRAASQGVANVSGDAAWPGRTLVPLASVAAAHRVAGRLTSMLGSLAGYV